MASACTWCELTTTLSQAIAMAGENRPSNQQFINDSRLKGSMKIYTR